MQRLLLISTKIDLMSEFIGKSIKWLVLVAVLISAANAIVRKLFDTSSNAWLEIQWYLFAAVFLFAAGYTMLKQSHVRIDIILNKFARTTQVKVEIFGIIFFLFPFVIAVIFLSWPIVMNAIISGEMSENAGGLIRWPAYLMIPVGFLLLGIQGISELIKRIGFLKNLCPDPAVISEKTDEEILAEEIKSSVKISAGD